jgi:hypothetical protein
MSSAFPLPPGLQPSPDDALRRDRLVRMQRVATGLLVVVAVLFVVARQYEGRYPALGYLRAFAEAAMVGGIADWFAVTALFRHPMGVPIPHTAIVPARKDRIGQALGQFVQRNFLAADVVREKLTAMHLGRRAAEWLVAPGHSAVVTRVVARSQTFKKMVETFGNLCKPQNLVLDAKQATCGKNTAAAAGGVKYTLVDATLNQIGGNITANDIVLNEQLGFMFVDMYYE